MSEITNYETIEEIPEASLEENKSADKPPKNKLPNNKFLRGLLIVLIWIKNFWLSIWKSKIKAFILLAIICVILLVIAIAYPAWYYSWLHMNSDDLLQYYPYMAAFFDKVKAGEVSFYDTNLFGGTSFFSGTYYIPLDIFSFIAFLLSYLMPGEIAYAITNFLRPVAGAMVIYYTFSRRFNIKVSFVSAMILLIGGMTEAYYIFPVYLGICFYAPLGMLLVDICTEKKGYWYLLVPLYSVAVIFYDFYIAYMILAFVCFYFLIAMFTRNQVSIFGENTIIKNKQFWITALKFYGTLVLGVIMSAWFLLPNALYIANESSRISSTVNEEVWFYSKYNSQAGGYVLSLRHYFTQWCNLFIANEPHRLCLVSAGDYIREHATLYITCGGLIYLVYFFLLKSKEARRLKIWVLLFNLIFLIPGVAMFFSFSNAPYVRWFFMPYLINLYAMAMAMNENDFKLGEENFNKLLPAIILALGLTTLLYVTLCNPEEFIHYSSNETMFWKILIPAIVAIIIYLGLLICSFILRGLKKNPWIIGKLIPLLIFIECGIGVAFILGNISNASSRYYYAKKENLNHKDKLVELYDYKLSDGYRINIYTAYGRDYVNNNVEIGNVNFGRFFQSFYSTPLNSCLDDIYHCSSTSISRTFNGGYTLFAAPMFNMKYVVSNENINLPEQYYDKEIVANGSSQVKYYSLKDSVPFIVYDDGFTNLSTTYTSSKYLLHQQLPLFSAYIKTTAEDSEAYDKLVAKNFEIKSSQELAEKLSVYSTYMNLDCKYRYENNGGTEYMYYDLSHISRSALRDGLLAWSLSSDVRNQKDGFIYLGKLNDPIYDLDKHTVTSGNPDKKWDTLYQFHYDNIYLTDDMDFNCIIVRNNENDSRYNVLLYCYDYDVYDLFVAEQAKYTNKYFMLDGDKMYIKCKMPDNTKTRIIKTGYAYSDDWKVNNEGYETVNVDAGFLGVIVPEGVADVDISLDFVPAGYQTGLKLSIGGCIIYLLIIAPIFTIIIIKRRKRSKSL